MTSFDELKCPHCGAPLAAGDVNVATDIVFCKACSQMGKLSELVEESEGDRTLDYVPRRIRVEKEAQGLVLTYKKPRIAGFFLIVFTLFWNSIVVTIFFAFLNEEKHFGLFEKLFFIPFFLVGIGTFCGAVYMLFGTTKLTLALGKGELFRGVGGIGRRQSFLLTKNARISIKESNIHVNHMPLKKIVVEQPSGKPFEFGTGISEIEAQEYVAALLRKMRRAV